MSVFDDALERLANTLVQGRGLFFIGSGFSLDSEPNSSQTILARIIARFSALTTLLGQREFYDLFKNTFRVKDPNDIDKDWIKRNQARYYEINDWMCSAYSTLLVECKSKFTGGMPELKFFEDLYVEEIAVFHGLLETPFPPSNKKLNEQAIKSYLQLGPGACGKALFLDTVGFAEKTIMAGEDVAGILKPRHFFLARLAREGLCPVLLTTNFDLLLEGGYRLSGMVRRGSEPQPPKHLYKYFQVVGDPNTFFNAGHGHRASLIVKIHGCAKHYRDVRKDHALSRQNMIRWRDYLKDVVYTYREIQNWRDDAWARDFVSTKIRTHDIVFIGYSGMDPVIHDTFRTVYEEMQRQRIPPSASPLPKDASCYHFDIKGKSPFYGMELLKAASRAQCVPDKKLELGTHPNLVQFHSKSSPARFPDLDEVLQWTFHRTFRFRQRELLRDQLETVASRLLGRPISASWHQNILKNFDALLDAEVNAASNWDDNTASRDGLRHATAWSERFQRLLLREFSLLQQSASQGSSSTPNEDRFEHRYEPLIDHPLHAAWGVVMEIALRRMIAHRQLRPDQWTNNDYWWHPSARTNLPYPGLKISVSTSPAPTFLFIVPQGVRLAGLLTTLRSYAVGNLLVWALPDKNLLWYTTPTSTPPLYCTVQGSLRVPSAVELLAWAGEVNPNSQENISYNRFLP
ncbi:MAG: SIR2 family protein [Magnetococcales bacterium]|nr:SIR2 family protein [Magnetococcales bacterium]MBF0114728.1 SIR2 family protein [Magnetococcales bacterium]